MGRLTGSRVYTSGSIDAAPDKGKGWRDMLDPFFRTLGIIHLNPCNKPINICQENIENIEYRRELKKQGKYEELSKIMRLIRVVDLRLSDLADFAIVNLNLDIPIMGTAEELFLMNRSKKAIIVYCPQGKDKINDWLWGTLPFEMFFDDWDDVKQYIINIDNGTDIRHFKRWMFFDYNKM